MVDWWTDISQSLTKFRKINITHSRSKYILGSANDVMILQVNQVSYLFLNTINSQPSVPYSFSQPTTYLIHLLSTPQSIHWTLDIVNQVSKSLSTPSTQASRNPPNQPEDFDIPEAQNPNTHTPSSSLSAPCPGLARGEVGHYRPWSGLGQMEENLESARAQRNVLPFVVRSPALPE